MISCALLLLLLPSLTATPTSALALPVLSTQDNFGHASEQHGAARTTHGAVASQSLACSEIGASLLRAGGNAVDALVATTLCVGVVSMYHSGIGGGGFMIVRTPQGEYLSVDFREAAPAAAFEDMYAGNEDGSVRGGLSVGVPGEIRGFEWVHRRFGRLKWKSVFEPAVKMAREGFVVNEDLDKYFKRVYNDGGTFLVDEPVWAQEFAPNGTLLQLGDTIYRPRYADTLERIGEEGACAFYTGPIAESIISTIQSTNGTMTLCDLAKYEVRASPAVKTTFRGLNIHATRAPSSGAITLSALKTMDQYPQGDWAASADDAHPYALPYHRFTESLRFAYGARAEFGDPDFVAGITELEDTIVAADAAAKRRARILDDSTQPVENYDLNRQGLTYATGDDHGTSHVVAVDNDGWVVSLTSTINLLFGSRLMTPDTGIILNNEMDDFSQPGAPNSFGYAPSPQNYIRPFKRPMSSISPVIASLPLHPGPHNPCRPKNSDWKGEDGLPLGRHITKDRPVLVTGAAGGSRIITSTAQVAWHFLSHNATLMDAMTFPRLHDQRIPDLASFEYSFNNNTIDGMIARGHNVSWVREGRSSVQSIAWERGKWAAVGEPRQENSGGVVVE